MDRNVTEAPRRRLYGAILTIAGAISFAATDKEEKREGKLST